MSDSHAVEAERDFHDYYNSAMARLHAIYLHSNPNKNLGDLMRELIFPIIRKNMSSEKILEGVQQLANSGDDLSHQQAAQRHAYLLLALGCCYDALVLKKQGSNLAWSTLSEAHEYAHEAEMLDRLEIMRDDIISKRGRKGSSTRAEYYEKIKIKAFELVREKCPTNKWYSGSEAIRKIYSELTEYVAQEKFKVKMPTEKTVTGWLADMHDSASYIRKKSIRMKESEF